jgi:hypothetical protein
LNFIKNTALVLVSTIFTVLSGECVLRLVVNPVNYLKPDLIADTYLNKKIAPYSAYHDAWGFRNENVPTKG